MSGLDLSYIKAYECLNPKTLCYRLDSSEQPLCHTIIPLLYRTEGMGKAWV